MIVKTITWLYVLLLLVAILLILAVKHSSKTRVWIKVKQKKGPFSQIGFLDFAADGSAAEVHAPGGGKKPPIGRVIADGNVGCAYVEALVSDIDDESEKPKYVRCGYLVGENGFEVDSCGFIYKKLKGNKEKTLVGYCAKPSNPDVPSLEGERSWRTLWMVKRLYAFEGRPSSTKNPQKKNSEAQLKAKSLVFGMSVEDVAEEAAKEVVKDVMEDVVKNDNNGLDAILDTDAVMKEESPAVKEEIDTPVKEETDTPIKQEAIEEVENKPEDGSKKTDDGVDGSGNEEKSSQKNDEHKDETKSSQKRKKSAKKTPKKKPIAIGEIHGWFAPNDGDFPAEARACAFGLLSKSVKKNLTSEYVKDRPYGWKDTALLSSLIYSVLFLTYYVINTGYLRLPLLGNDLLAVLILIAAYFALWALVRLVKIDFAENSNSFQAVIDLLNKNLGLKSVNTAIVVLSVLAFLFTIFYFDYDLLPLIFAIGFGTMMNMSLKGANKTWKISTSYNDDDVVDEELGEDIENPPGDIARNYEWDLDPSYSGQKLHGNITLYFSSRDVEDVRQINPFFSQRKDKSDREYILDMFKSLKEHKAFMARVRYLASYIRKTVLNHHLTPLDEIQFALDFVQEPNIQFVRNSECKAINYYEDYIRYPDETLYDKQGDCNSKSLLAAMIFHSLGKNVLYLTSRKYNHAAIGIEVDESELVNYASPERVKQITVEAQDRKFIFCETTGDRFNIGSTYEGMKLEEFDDKMMLPYRDDSSIFDDTEDIPQTKVYNWDLDSFYKEKLHGNIALNFDAEAIEDLRSNNPFRTYGEDGRSYVDNIRTLFDYILDDPERMAIVNKLAQYIQEQTQSMRELDRAQFALDFVQEPNISYKVDENSQSIDFRKEYMRFPDEVLYDKEGDCDCKSSLLAVLFHALGYKVIVLLSEKLQHAGIGVQCSEGWLDIIAPPDRDKVVREYNATEYIYCETTGDGYKIGQIKDDYSIQDFEHVIEI